MLKRDITIKPQKKRKGQSTVEYIILVAAIIGALIIFLPTTFQNAYNAALQFRVSKTVSTSRISAPPSTRPRT